MTRKPANRNQVCRDVEPALRSVLNVMQSRVFDVTPAYTAHRLVSVQHIVPNVRRDKPKRFKLHLRRHPSQR